MPDMQLKVNVESDESVFAAFACPCGCHPGARLTRDDALATEGCCCGTQFAIGHDAARHVIEHDYVSRPSFELLVQPVTTPWGPTIAAFAVGRDFSGCPCDNSPVADATAQILDPVCGMAVDSVKAAEAGFMALDSDHAIYFCSNSCLDQFLARRRGPSTGA